MGDSFESKVYRKRYWPFELDVRWTDEASSSKIAFLSEAHAAGYQAYMDQIGDVGASHDARNVEIVRRGRTHWELVLAADGTLTVAAHLNSFDVCGSAALSWLPGANTRTILEHIRDHLMPQRTNPQGYFVLDDHHESD